MKKILFMCCMIISCSLPASDKEGYSSGYESDTESNTDSDTELDIEQKTQYLSTNFKTLSLSARKCIQQIARPIAIKKHKGKK